MRTFTCTRLRRASADSLGVCGGLLPDRHFLSHTVSDRLVWFRADAAPGSVPTLHAPPCGILRSHSLFSLVAPRATYTITSKQQSNTYHYEKNLINLNCCTLLHCRSNWSHRNVCWRFWKRSWILDKIKHEHTCKFDLWIQNRNSFFSFHRQ